MVWFIFLASTAVIVVAWTKLSQYGDRIADLTGLGRFWIGVLLPAAAHLPAAGPCRGGNRGHSGKDMNGMAHSASA